MTAATDTALQVTPLSGWTGALITGVDLSAPLSADEIAAIRTALHQWKVVFFRDQELDHAAQIAFGAQFGDVTPGHPYEGDSAPAGLPADPHRLARGLRPPLRHQVPQEAEPERPGLARRRHPVDQPAVALDPARRSRAALRRRHPVHQRRRGVRRASPPSVREFIDELRAEHRFGATVSAERSSEKIGDLVRSNPLASIHPVVRVHPETKERVLYVNPSFTREIVDLSPRESRHVLDLLFEEIARPEYTVRFKWEPGSVAFWDNRAALHLAPRDFEHVEGDRVLHRITLVGDVPVGTGRTRIGVAVGRVLRGRLTWRWCSPVRGRRLRTRPQRIARSSTRVR